MNSNNLSIIKKNKIKKNSTLLPNDVIYNKMRIINRVIYNKNKKNKCSLPFSDVKNMSSRINKSDPKIENKI